MVFHCSLVPMNLTRIGHWIGAALLFSQVQALATDFTTTIPMRDKGMATYYVEGEIAGVGPIDLLVDTGSGYLTINQAALEDLLRHQRAGFVKELTGILADGSELVVPVYSIESLRIGASCWLRDIEAAVFPGKTRFILGLSALQKAGPFIFDFDPPSLTLSRCGTLSS